LMKKWFLELDMLWIKFKKSPIQKGLTRIPQ